MTRARTRYILTTMDGDKHQIVKTVEATSMVVDSSFVTFKDGSKILVIDKDVFVSACTEGYEPHNRAERKETKAQKNAKVIELYRRGTR